MRSSKICKQNETKKKKGWSSATLLVLLCWFIYAGSYIGKVNYAANINQVMEFYKVSHSEAGLVSTLFFFAYGIGQVVNGLFCKKYNIKWMVFGSLMVSALANVVVGLTTDFTLVQVVWLLNGFSMSVLWPCLVRLLSETISKKRLARASVVMGTTVATGTLVVYGLSALFVHIDFKIVFFLATGVFFVAGGMWLSFVSLLCKKAKILEQSEEGDAENTVQTSSEQSPSEGLAQNAPIKKQSSKVQGVLVIILTLCTFGVLTNLIKDGLSTWVPSILKEQYHLGSSLSIILTLTLPILGVFGNAFAVFVHKKVPNYVLQCTLMFSGAGSILGVVIAGLSLGQFAITLVGFALVYFLVSSNNSVITSIFPLLMKGKLNSGMIAGILNGCCYVGSTLSSYGLGLIADVWGWSVVFWVLFVACATSVIVGAIYKFTTKLQAK